MAPVPIKAERTVSGNDRNRPGLPEPPRFAPEPHHLKQYMHRISSGGTARYCHAVVGRNGQEIPDAMVPD